MVILEARETATKTVKHLASEYDADYIHIADQRNEAYLLNRSLKQAPTSWALFLNQQEVLHMEDSLPVLKSIKGTNAIAFDFPVIRLAEPNNYHFEIRLIRTDKNLRWQHAIHPTLNSSLNMAVEKFQLSQVAELMPHVAVVSLGEPEREERELQERLVRIEKELEKDPLSARYWHHLARIARRLELWPRAHQAVEEGLNVISRRAEATYDEPDGANGLLGMFCESLLKGKFDLEKTVNSLWTIFHNMVSDGRFSVPLGRLLLASGRRKQMVAAQLVAMENFFNKRRYHLPLEEGLYSPALLIWEIESDRGDHELLNSVIKVQSLLKQHKFDFQIVLKYIYEQNRDLFSRIQEVLQESLRKKR